MFKTIFLRNTESNVLIWWKLKCTGNFEWVPGPLKPPLAIWGLKQAAKFYWCALIHPTQHEKFVSCDKQFHGEHKPLNGLSGNYGICNTLWLERPELTTMTAIYSLSQARQTAASGWWPPAHGHLAQGWLPKQHLATSWLPQATCRHQAWHSTAQQWKQAVQGRVILALGRVMQWNDHHPAHFTNAE